MKQKIMILMLMVAAMFSGHAQKLSQISAQADSSSGIGPCEHGGGATCET
jgi:hypothetical protein